MTSRAERETLTGAANQMMRLLLNDLDAVKSQISRDADHIRTRREEIRQTIGETEQRARAHIARFGPEDAGEDLRRIARKTIDVPPRRSPQAPPPSFDEATREWGSLERALKDVGDILIARVAWKGRILKRRSSMPTVTSELWHSIDRLSEIHAALPALREKYVATAVAEHAHLHDELAAATRDRARAVGNACADMVEKVEGVEEAVGQAGARWGDPGWAGAAPAGKLQSILRLGDLEAQLPQSIGPASIPAFVEFPFSNGISIATDVDHRKAATDLARSLIFRVLAAVPAGAVRFVFIDPVSLGQSVAEFRHLAEFDTRLVDQKTWTSERDIESRLEELSDHLEVVISTYLRGQFESIDDYNRHAGEVAEPYRVVVVFDYPQGFTSRSSRQLLSLIENGPRCGVHTILIHGPEQERSIDIAVDRLIHSMQQIDLTRDRGRLTLADPIGTIDLAFLPDTSPPITFTADGQATTPFARLLLSIGAAARSSQSGPVTLDRVMPIVNKLIASGRSQHLPQLSAEAPALDPRLPATWWNGISAAGTYAPIGRAGAQDIAALYFSSIEIAGGGIIVGLPRSGKSTAMHAAILSMAMIYPPEELEFYLVDSKHGVEFKVYDELPHARLVSINSEREFSVAVLQSLDGEIKRRADLMKRDAAGKANITEYRKATGEEMPRIVLFMDEFHELFEEDDALGHAAYEAFSNIVRLGPFAGIHAVVGSQTLSSMPAMDRSVLRLLPMRVAFMCNEEDADLVMGDTNREVKALAEQGEGILNPSRGEPSHNQPFRGLYVAPDERDDFLASIQEKSAEWGFERRPRVFDGDTLVDRPSTAPEGFTTRPVFRLGEPFTLEPWAGVTLRRGRGANVLLLGASDDDHPDIAIEGATHSCLSDAAAGGLTVHVVDFIGDCKPAGESLDLARVCKAVGASYRRGSALNDVLLNVAEAIASRREKADYDAPAVLVVLHGLHRALDLEADDPYASHTDRDQTVPEMSECLAGILRDGPELGCHTAVSVDGLEQFEKRLGRDLLKEFDWRIVGSGLRPTDVAALTDAYTEGEVRHSQLLIVDHARGTRRRVRAYPPHTAPSIHTSTNRTAT